MNLEDLTKRAYLEAGCDPAWVSVQFDMADKLYPDTPPIIIPDDNAPRLLRGMIATIKARKPLSSYLFTPEAQKFFENRVAQN